jgi:hypothetical protein
MSPETACASRSYAGRAGGLAGEAAHSRDDEGRVSLGEPPCVEAEPAGALPRSVVEQQVAASGQQIQDVAAVRGPQVDDDAPLVAVDGGEVGAQAVGGRTPVRRSPGTRLVAAGRLDLDDVGAEVGQEHGGERSGEDAAAVDDADPVERERSRGVVRHGPLIERAWDGAGFGVARW